MTLKKIPLVDLDVEESGQSRALRQLHAIDARIPNGAAKQRRAAAKDLLDDKG